MSIPIINNILRKIKILLINSNNKNLARMQLEYRIVRRKALSKNYEFVTMEELVCWTSDWIKTFSEKYDLIIGIPRSGLLVANIVASKLGKPLTTPALFYEKKLWVSNVIDSKNEYKNILLVDDSIFKGNAMRKALEKCNSNGEKINITTAALLATEESKEFVDLYYKILPVPRIFEWNLLHGKKGVTATDMDGVLCENCPAGIDNDEEKYQEWIKTAKPYLIPAFEIDVIISSRLEKHRADTEKWLSKYGVRYKNLILWDIKNKQDRAGKYTQHKIDDLLKIKPDIYWESNYNQAEQIWKATKIPTLCTDEMVFFS